MRCIFCVHQVGLLCKKRFTHALLCCICLAVRGLFSDTWRKNPDTTICVCATWLWRCKATPCPLSSACLVLDCCAIKNVVLNFALCLVLPQPSKPQPEPSPFVGQLLRNGTKRSSGLKMPVVDLPGLKRLKPPSGLGGMREA